MSAVWKLFKKAFDENGSEIAVCSLCPKSLKVPKSKTTTNSLKHLQECHEGELASVNEAKRKQPSSVQDFPSQRNLHQTFHPKLNATTKARIDKKLALLVANTSLPLRITTLSWFKDFASSLNSGYSPPCPRTLMSTMEGLVKEIDEEHGRLVTDANAKVAITADCWSSQNLSCSLLGITAHVLSPNFADRENIVLDCIPLDGSSHTGEFISEKIMEVLRKFEISEKIQCFVADGASVMKKAASLIDVPYLHCCAHLVNLAVQASLVTEPAARLLRRLKTVVTKLNKSAKYRNCYKKFLENHSLPIKIPFRDCPTRWGSTFTMICDILDSLPAFEELLTTLKMDPFEEEEARFLRAMKTFLEPFSHMTKQVCSQRATCSMHIAVGQTLIKKTERNCASARREAKMFGEALLAKATSYFKPWFDDEFLQTAALCDPRFAFLETVLTLEEWRATVDRMVNRAVHNWEDPAADEGEDSPAAEDNMRVIKIETVSKTPHAWDVLLEDEEAVASPGPTTREDEIRIEIQQYSMLLKKPGARPQFDSNPIEWWRTHKGEFPLMASQVPAYLVAPPSSVDCERLFSTASLLYENKRRGRLSSKTARTLLLVKVHSNAKIARESRSWTALEAKRYGYPENIEDIFCSSSDEEACSVTEDDSIIEEDEF